MSKRTLAGYERKLLRLKLEEELDTLVSFYINEGLPLPDISYVLEMQKFGVDEAMEMTDNIT